MISDKAPYHHNHTGRTGRTVEPPSHSYYRKKKDDKNSRKLEAQFVHEEKLQGWEGYKLSILQGKDDGREKEKSHVISAGMEIRYMAEEPYGRKEGFREITRRPKVLEKNF